MWVTTQRLERAASVCISNSMQKYFPNEIELITEESNLESVMIIRDNCILCWFETWYSKLEPKKEKASVLNLILPFH